MTKRILICDDDVSILRAVEFKLKQAGLEVTSARDGLEAWEMILENPPDMLVTDCQMPRMDGFGLCRHIHDDPRLNDLPILMLTAKGFELSADDLKEQHGVRAIMSKPFSPRELLQTVERLMEQQSAAAPG